MTKQEGICGLKCKPSDEHFLLTCDHHRPFILDLQIGLWDWVMPAEGPKGMETLHAVFYKECVGSGVNSNPFFPFSHQGNRLLKTL